MLRVGSMCSGYGGLDMALEMALGEIELQWVCEFAKDPSLILAERFPDVPNYGDLLTHKWETAPAIDALSAGFPCQPVSMAGNRKGTADTRWIFDDICSAVSRMVSRPRLLLFENVRGLLSANNGDAMARVVQGMARIGYVGRYRILPASAVGAPHRRERVFIIAWPVEHGSRPRIGQLGRRQVGSHGTVATGDHGRAARRGFTSVPLIDEGLLPTPVAQDTGGNLFHKGSGKDGSAQVGAPSQTLLGALLPTPMTSADHKRDPAENEQAALPHLLVGHGSAPKLIPTPSASDDKRTTGPSAPHGDWKPGGVGAAFGLQGGLLPTPTAHDRLIGRDAPGRTGGQSLGPVLLPTPIAHDSTLKEFQYGDQPMLAGAVLNVDTARPKPFPEEWEQAAADALKAAEESMVWWQDTIPGLPDTADLSAYVGYVDEEVTHRLGVYGPAADRWAAIVGREAPEPTYVDEKDNRRKLNPAFGEWMMGLPAGWVTDVLPARKALRAIGNGVVPQQAAAAVRLLMSTVVEASE